MKRLSNIGFLLLLLAGVACQEEVKTRQELLRWVNDEGHGYVQTRQVGDLNFSMKILPAEYLALKDVEVDETLNQNNFDELQKFYDSSVTFVFTINFSEPEEFSDVGERGIRNFDEFKDRMAKMNFGMQEQFLFRTESFEVQPALVNMENNYGMTPGRSFVVVFPLEGNTGENFREEAFEIEYEDVFFESGTMVFTFSERDKLPKVKV